MTPSDRKRLIAASVLTVIALPTLWSEKRSSPVNQASVAAVGADSDSFGQVTETVSAEPIDTAPVYFDIGGDVPVTNGPFNIATAPTVSGPQASGQAVYRRVAHAGDACQSPLASVGTTLRVKNLDNGQTVTCRNVSAEPLPDGVIIAMNAAVFQKVADLVESPVPVSVSW